MRRPIRLGAIKKAAIDLSVYEQGEEVSRRFFTHDAGCLS